MMVFMKDDTSAANAMSIKFLDSYMKYTPEVEPADFDARPVLLTPARRGPLAAAT